MKVCVTASGHNFDSILDQRFGRAACFVMVETETMNIIEAFDNEALDASEGAGIASAQLMVDKDIEALVTGNVGPKAMSVLKKANIIIYKGLPETVEKNIVNFKNKKLEEIEMPGPAHHGMGRS